MMKQSLQRHGLVWLDPDLDVSPYVTVPEHTSRAQEWISKGLPLVIARQPKLLHDIVTYIAVGLTLPPPPTRQRVSLYVPTKAILRQSGPMQLEQTLHNVDERCRELIQRIAVLCRDTNIMPYIYGSALWQTVSRSVYMTDTSDIDILFVCNESSNIHALLESLIEFDGSMPRLDGEIVMLTGWAAAWREVAAACKAGGPDRILAKSIYEAKMLSRGEFFGQKDA